MDKRHTLADAKFQIKLARLRKELREAEIKEIQYDIHIFKPSKAIFHQIRLVERAQRKNQKEWEKINTVKAKKHSELQYKQSELNIEEAIIGAKERECGIIAAQMLSPHNSISTKQELNLKLKEIKLAIRKHKQALGFKRRGLQILKGENQFDSIPKSRGISEEFNSLDDYLSAEIKALDNVKATSNDVILAQRMLEEFQTTRTENTSLKENRFEFTEE
jgi:hypothetical protein